jgi:hypothetical protein
MLSSQSMDKDGEMKEEVTTTTFALKCILVSHIKEEKFSNLLETMMCGSLSTTNELSILVVSTVQKMLLLHWILLDWSKDLIIVLISFSVNDTQPNPIAEFKLLCNFSVPTPIDVVFVKGLEHLAHVPVTTEIHVP